MLSPYGGEAKLKTLRFHIMKSSIFTILSVVIEIVVNSTLPKETMLRNDDGRKIDTSKLLSIDFLLPLHSPNSIISDKFIGRLLVALGESRANPSSI